MQAVNNANIADPVAKELANKVEGVLHNSNLGKMREQVQKLGTALDTRQWLFDLAASIDTDLQTLRSEVGRSIGNVRPSADHAQALLNVMTRRTGLHNLLHNSQMSSNAVESKRKQVYENCKAFYDDWAAVILNELFERYERPQMIDVGVLTKLDVAMEKWAWAIFVRNSTDSQLKDMANATKGLLGSEESVFMKRMTALGIVVRRQDRSTQDEAMKATTLAGAAAGRQFAVGYSTVGDTSIRALRGWSDFMLGKSPIDHALSR